MTFRLSTPRRIVLFLSVVFFLSVCLVFSLTIFAKSPREPRRVTRIWNEVKPANDRPKQHTEVGAFKYDYKPEGSVEYHPLHWAKDILGRPIELLNLTAPFVPSTATLIILVPVMEKEREKRDIIRSLWASKRHSQALRDGKMAVLFFLASKTVPASLKEEVKQFDDILIVFGFEEYRRLLFKFYFGYKWVNHYYPLLDVAKVDADVLFLPDNFYKTVITEKRPFTVTGHLLRETVIVRDKTSKWYIPESSLNGTHYPPSFHGFTYVFKAQALAKILAEAATMTHIYENEDAFFTGTLTQRTGVQLINNPNIFYGRPEDLVCDENGRPQLISYTRMGLRDLVEEYYSFKKLPCRRTSDY